MTQQQINALKVGDRLRISNPKSPAAKLHRQQILAIREPVVGIRVATIAYFYENHHYHEDTNECELNYNLFGSMEVCEE